MDKPSPLPGTVKDHVPLQTVKGRAHAGFALRRPATLLLIVLAHLLALYGLGRVFAPDLSARIEGDIIATFTVPVEEPSQEPPPADPQESEGAAASEGEKARAAPIAAPRAERKLREPRPFPPVAGEGGEGTGTGSGSEGRGLGGAAVTKPVHISGEINNARDFPVPPGGRGARRGNEVIVRLIVGVDGRPTECTIYRPSPDPEADRITCQLAMERLRFRPASDGQGRPVPAPFYWRQRWF